MRRSDKSTDAFEAFLPRATERSGPGPSPSIAVYVGSGAQTRPATRHERAST